MQYAISPHYLDSKLASKNINDMIDVYDDQIKGWLLSPIQLLVSNQHSGFAILTLVLTYFESIGQFLTGMRGASCKQFEKGIKAVFPSLDPSIHKCIFTELYDQLRCGLFHRGITKGKVSVVHGLEVPIVVVYTETYIIQTIEVDPWLLLNEIKNHHTNYINKLRDEKESVIRENFVKWFELRGI